MLITARQLSSGRWHIKGPGLANWAQPPFWPCDLETLLSNAFVASTDEFIESALEAAKIGEEHNCRKCDREGRMNTACDVAHESDLERRRAAEAARLLLVALADQASWNAISRIIMTPPSPRLDGD